MILLAALGGIVGLLIYLLIFLIVLSLVYWLINQFMPEPLRRYAIAVVIVIAAIMLIYLLLGLAGNSDVLKP